jgi:hypothetical protein
MLRGRLFALVGGALVAMSSPLGCGIEKPPRSPLEEARDAAGSGDADAVGRWLLAELTSQGGTPKGAKDARAKLDASKGGLDAKLAAAVDDDVHGRGVKAFEEWLDVLRAARVSDAPRAPLVALVAVEAITEVATLVPRPHRLEAIRALAPLVTSTSSPNGLGWRASSSLARIVASASDWGKPQAEHDVIRQKTIGCASALRMAGPFMHAPGDDDVSPFEGERAGVWPAVFEGRPKQTIRPRIVDTIRNGCTFTGKDAPAGDYLAEAFFTLPRTMDVVLVPDDVTRIAVDDVAVHVVDPTLWGGPLHDGVAVRLQPGRHRVVWRASEGAASIEVRALEGTTLDLSWDVDPTPPYGTATKPETLDDVHPALAASKRDDVDPTTRWLAAQAALDGGASDVAAVILGDVLATEPPNVDRPGAYLETAAQAALHDPIWPATRASSRAKILFDKAAELDLDLWLSPLVSIELEGEGTPPTEKVKRLAALVARTAERPNAALRLIDQYDDLGWTLEHDQLVAQLGKKFPDDPSVLEEEMKVLDAHGPLADADVLAARLAQDEPDRPIMAERMLERHDWKGAVAEYEKFVAAHPDQKSLKLRLDDLKNALGNVDDATKQLAEEIAKGKASPLDEADWRLATGEKYALDAAIAHAIRDHGVRPSSVERALELLQQTVDFSPFRLDARKVIAEHDKTHASKSAGAAERILDYGAMWIRSDGTNAFLEHEIVRVNSREAIDELSRVVPKQGKALHLRVLKKDGRELEPVKIAGKPDLTFPDLDVGDVIETETIMTGSAPASAYLAPQWFFAEPQIAYARSEYVVITPKGRAVIVEARAGAPNPVVSTWGAFDVRRWRVDDAPPAPDEADPTDYHRKHAEEFLPNVTFGWGFDLDEAIARAAVAFKETTPIDPRIAQKAREIVGKIPAEQSLERARKLYEWSTHTIQKGNETDGRRVVVGGQGDPAAAFRVLVRALGIVDRIVVVHDKIAPPATTPLSAGDGYRDTLLLLRTDQGPRYLSFGGRYLPFGYVPPTARGEEGIVLEPGAPRVKLPTDGIVDGLRVEGGLKLDQNGDAVGTLTLYFEGVVGAGVREGIDQATEGELAAAVESRILAAELPGVHLVHLQVLSRDELDAPLGLRVDVEVPQLARATGASNGGSLVVFAPFQRRLAALVQLSSRKTPLVIEQADLREVKIDLALPVGAKLVKGPIKGAQAFGPDRASVEDAFDGSTLRFHRLVEIGPARVEASQYAALQAFVRAADGLGSEETILSF